jgi:hypothetical protein
VYPKGSSAQAARIELKNTQWLKNEIAMQWKERLNELAEERPMKQNELDKLINEKKRGAPTYRYYNQQAPYPTVSKRIKAICQPHSGTKTPKDPVEKYIVSLMEQMAKMRQPLNISEELS